MLGTPFDGACEHDALHISAHCRAVLDTHRMIHARDVLLDDRTFIKILRDVVRGGANELHTPVVRLLIGLRTLKTRQKRSDEY
jgi:hypothetical protein